MIWIYLVGGFAALTLGGDVLVRGAVRTARRFGLSPMLAGLIIVGFGTSLPELVTSVEAAIKGYPGLALGNVVGSNTANALLVLGLSALIVPLTCSRSALNRDGPVLALATVLAVALAMRGDVGLVSGLVLLAMLAVYVIVSVHLDGRRDDDTSLLHGDSAAAAEYPVMPRALSLALFFIVVGLIGVALGAHWVVTGSVALARQWQVPDEIIGLTIVALGTSLPEVATTIMAALQRQTDVVLGNIVGSNIFNILGILGVTAIVQPLAVPETMARFDVWVMAGATASLLVLAMGIGRVTRGLGLLLILGYVAYIAMLAQSLA